MRGKQLSIFVLSLFVLWIVPAGPAFVTADPPDPPLAVLSPPVVWQGGGVALSSVGCGGELTPVIHADYEQELVERVNAERAVHGLPPLKRAAPLDEAARYHARDLAEDDYFSHDSFDRQGENLVQMCDTWARIRSYYPSPSAENIAAGFATPQTVLAAWMNSDGHQSNILSTYSWEIGAGYYAYGGTYGRYWVQDFGRRDGVYPLIINQEAKETSSRDVSLYVYGSWDEVRLRNDGGPWSAWRPFENVLDWTLGPGRGEHTVWAEMRWGSQTASASDSIYLSLAPPTLGDLPDAIKFTYSLVDGRIFPESGPVVPENVGSDDVLTWNLALAGAWFTASSLSGTTPDPFWIVPKAVDVPTTTTYAGVVTVTVTNPASVDGSPHTIDLTLRVIDRPIWNLYMPVAACGTESP